MGCETGGEDPVEDGGHGGAGGNVQAGFADVR